MVFEELLSAYERYGRLENRRALSKKEQDFDRLIIAFYTLGGGGISVVDEYTLYELDEFSQVDLFEQVDTAITGGLIRAESSLDHYRWSLTLQGRMYAEALVGEFK